MEIKTLIDQMILDAYRKQAADIYVVPVANKYQVQFHLNNQINPYQSVSRQCGSKIVNYFKYNGNMLISEHRRPQIGAMEWRRGSAHCYLRFSTVGDFKSREAIVVRLIYPLAVQSNQFLNPDQYEQLKRRTIQRGLMVFAGPTGSGKTTTIYQLAREYSSSQMVMSIEDPVEVYEPSFLQLQVNSDADMSYQELLKVGLRNRPDIFIIGEIRDANTAQAAVQAALSGHLVLTTLHAKHPLGVVERLLNLGVGLDYLKQALNMVAYQRLLQTPDNGFAALLNTVTSEQIFEDALAPKAVLECWQASLNQLVAQKQIMDSERERIWHG
ncbi:competence type IV pilus ATPase ComGA [Nicoliella lavandulae]|uniref:Competence type IV pilus ATPase ComGA n=1 Tax=Nicoliella lavandulae TaxID=3082954 RepID=A0ABU8SKJ3_9LACO